MKAVCGANCDDCELLKSKKCEGCQKTNGCPFGNKCWIAKYIETDKGYYEVFKKSLIKEFNDLNIDGMPEIDELYPLHGEYVNLEYRLPNGEKVKFIDDNDAYLGNEVECSFNDKSTKKCFGLLANMNFLLVCEYEENGNNAELLVYKKR
jgi:hypothetical protein